jgi:ribosomal protein S27E
MNGFRNFMVGRYGTDQLTVALLIVGMILTFIGNAFNLYLITMITYVIFFACIYRLMSKNILARQKENNKFLQYWNPSKTWLKAKYNVIKSSKDYKYFKCPNCKQELRVPRGKGKIAVTCKKCGTKFIQKS